MSRRWVGCLVLMLGAGAGGPAAVAGEPDLLAPSPDGVTRGLDRIDRLLALSNEPAADLSAAHHAWVVERCVARNCRWSRAEELAEDARLAGQAVRDLVQSARAELDRVQRIAGAATVAPLLDPAMRARVSEAQAEVTRHTDRWLANTTWHRLYVAWHPAARRADVPCAEDLRARVRSTYAPKLAEAQTDADAKAQP